MTSVPLSLPSLPPVRRPRWQLPLVLLLLLVGMALFAPLIAPYSPDPPADFDVQSYLAPSSLHPFGTDVAGRDVLSRVIYGSRVSLSLSAASVALALLLGTTYGAVAGLVGGIVDRVLMRLLDVALSIPRLLLLLAITAFWQRLSLLSLIVLLGITGWFDVARMVRGEVQSLAQREFVVAARATGVRSWRILTHHILPHLVPVLIVAATLNVAGTIALESGLSYLGLGVQPPTPSWGKMMFEGTEVMATRYWITLFPGLATVAAVLICHALGDALRDLFALDQVHA